MNTLFAASLFDSPWVLLVIVLVGALSQWLMKRRQAHEADSRTDGDAPLSLPGKSHERSLRELDLQEALRQLLGGEPPPRAPQPPPIPPVMRDPSSVASLPGVGASDNAGYGRKQSSEDGPLRRVDAQPAEDWSDEEQFQPEQAWRDEPHETYEAARPPAIQTAPPSRAHLALVRANATRIESSERQEKAAGRFEQLSEQGRHPATVGNTGRARRSREGTRAIGLLRDHRTVRQAFVASLVFGPPKAFEDSRL